MRGLFAIAFSFVILEAFVGLQPASVAAPKCVPVNMPRLLWYTCPVTTCDQGAADHPATEK